MVSQRCGVRAASVLEVVDLLSQTGVVVRSAVVLLVKRELRGLVKVSLILLAQDLVRPSRIGKVVYILQGVEPVLSCCVVVTTVSQSCSATRVQLSGTSLVLHPS